MRPLTLSLGSGKELLTLFVHTLPMDLNGIPLFSLLQSKLGCRGGAAFSVEAACAGFMYALVTAVDPHRNDEAEPPELSEEASPDRRMMLIEPVVAEVRETAHRANGVLQVSHAFSAVR